MNSNASRRIAVSPILAVLLAAPNGCVAFYPDTQSGLSGVICSTTGALVGSTVGNGQGQTLAAGVGVPLGAKAAPKTDRYELHLTC